MIEAGLRECASCTDLRDLGVGGVAGEVWVPGGLVWRAVDLATDKAAVTEAFAAYRKAILAKDGEAVAALLTADSIAYYAALKNTGRTFVDQTLAATLSSPGEIAAAWKPVG